MKLITKSLKSQGSTQLFINIKACANYFNRSSHPSRRHFHFYKEPFWEDSSVGGYCSLKKSKPSKSCESQFYLGNLLKTVAKETASQ